MTTEAAQNGSLPKSDRHSGQSSKVHMYTVAPCASLASTEHGILRTDRPVHSLYTALRGQRPPELRLAAGASTRGHWCSGGGPPVRPEAQTRCLPECSMTAGLHGGTGVQTEGRLCGPKSNPGALHWRPAAGCDFENLLRLRAVVWRPKQHKTGFCSCQHVASRAGDRFLTTSSLLCGSCNQGGCRFACELFDSSPPPPWP